MVQNQTDKEVHVVDVDLAALAFVAGYKAAEGQLDGAEVLQAFIGSIIVSYPQTDKYEQVQHMRSAFMRVWQENKGG